jgi:hypothetical protein
MTLETHAQIAMLRRRIETLRADGFSDAVIARVESMIRKLLS